MPEIPAPAPPPYESPESMLARTDWYEEPGGGLGGSVEVAHAVTVCYPAVVTAWCELVSAAVVERTACAEVEWGIARDASLLRENRVRLFVSSKGPYGAGELFRRLDEDASDLFRRLGEEMEA